MKVALAFFLLLLCVVPVYSQSDSSDSSRCLPRKPHFPALREARPQTDEYLYPRYFRYVKEWDECFADGKWPASTVEQYPDPFYAGMDQKERRIVTLAAREWDVAPPEATLIRMEPGSEIVARPMGVMTWADLQQLTQQRQREAKETDERAKLVEAGLEKLRLQLGKTSFLALDEYVHRLYHAIPGRLVHQPLPEAAMYGRYLHTIAMMDKFAANGGDDAQAAADARAEEQTACGLNDKEQGILQQVAEDFQKELSEHMPAPRFSGRADGMERPAAAAADRPARPGLSGERNRIIDSHIEQLRSGLGEAGFEKVENRVHVLYRFDGLPRVVPVDAPEKQSKAGEPLKAAP